MNLTGQWKGEFTYGSGYSHTVKGKSELFDLFIIDKDGSISGSCVDNIVNEKLGNEAYIIGTFLNKNIKFKKRYKFHSVIDDLGNNIFDHNIQIDGVDYTGTLKRRFFSKIYYFKGEWSITAQLDDNSKINCRGTWYMKKV